MVIFIVVAVIFNMNIISLIVLVFLLYAVNFEDEPVYKGDYLKYKLEKSQLLAHGINTNEHGKNGYLIYNLGDSMCQINVVYWDKISDFNALNILNNTYPLDETYEIYVKKNIIVQSVNSSYKYANCLMNIDEKYNEYQNFVIKNHKYNFKIIFCIIITIAFFLFCL